MENYNGHLYQNYNNCNQNNSMMNQNMSGKGIITKNTINDAGNPMLNNSQKTKYVIVQPMNQNMMNQQNLMNQQNMVNQNQIMMTKNPIMANQQMNQNIQMTKNMMNQQIPQIHQIMVGNLENEKYKQNTKLKTESLISSGDYYNCILNKNELINKLNSFLSQIEIQNNLSKKLIM